MVFQIQFKSWDFLKIDNCSVFRKGFMLEEKESEKNRNVTTNREAKPLSLGLFLTASIAG